MLGSKLRLFACLAFAYANEVETPEEDLVTVRMEDLLADRTKEFAFGFDHFVGGKWLPRGDVRLTYGVDRTYTAKLTDHKDFSPDDLVKFAQASPNDFYKLRLQPSDGKFSLFASIPASFLKDVEDRHDTIELTLSPSGVPIGFSFIFGVNWKSLVIPKIYPSKTSIY